MKFKKIAAIIGLTGTFVSTMHLGSVSAESYGTVNENNLRMREETNTNSKILGHLQKGEQVKVLAHHDKWLYVEEQGLRYFVYQDYVDIKKSNENYVKKERFISSEKKNEKATNFMMPTNGVISQKYGTASGVNGYTFHNGIDIANAQGTVIQATQEGEIIQSGYQNAYGNYVMIKHRINNKSYVSVYAHLMNRSVSKGQHVKMGQVIGKMGSTGNSTGSHLHFELHENYYHYSGNAAATSVNPLLYTK